MGEEEEERGREEGGGEGGSASLPGALITAELHLGPSIGGSKSFKKCCCFLAQTVFSF